LFFIFIPSRMLVRMLVRRADRVWSTSNWFPAGAGGSVQTPRAYMGGKRGSTRMDKKGGRGKWVFVLAWPARLGPHQVKWPHESALGHSCCEFTDQARKP
jgi:hypothetical protein